MALCLSGFVATFYISRQSGRWPAKTISPIVGAIAVGVIGIVFLRLFPPTIVLMERWEYLTLIFGGPLYGLLLWGPLGLGQERRDRDVPTIPTDGSHRA